MTQRGSSYSDAGSHLFGQPIRSELDPAQLLDELRGLRPLMDRLGRLAPMLDALEGLNIGQVQEFRRAMQEHSAVMARLDQAHRQLGRIEEVIALLDELDVIVRRQ